MSDIIDLEKTIDYPSQNRRVLQERLDEREGIESDRYTDSKRRKEEVHQQRKTEEMKVSTQERFLCQDLQRLIQKFFRFKKKLLGISKWQAYDSKDRRSIRFQKVVPMGLRTRISELQNEECRLRELMRSERETVRGFTRNLQGTEGHPVSGAGSPRAAEWSLLRVISVARI